MVKLEPPTIPPRSAAMAFRRAAVLSGQTTIVRDTQRFCGSARFDFVVSWSVKKFAC